MKFIRTRENLYALFCRSERSQSIVVLVRNISAQIYIILIRVRYPNEHNRSESGIWVSVRHGVQVHGREM